MHEKQKRILSFWFGDNPFYSFEKRSMWFSKDLATDALIRELFIDDLNEAELGAFDDWVQTTNGALALVILLDQFPRHIYRGEPKAFAYDEQALRAAQIAISNHLDSRMSLIERCFLYLPFEHSENLEIQEQSVDMFRRLKNEAHGNEEEVINEALEYALKHREIIKAFGRFPHRNEILSRESTTHEREFLKRPGSSF